MNVKYAIRAIIVTAITGTFLGITPGTYASDITLAGNQNQAAQAPVMVRRNITICELLRFNFDVKAKLYNQVTEPLARESYRADIQDIERLMNEAACK